jgi:hypothetical protein
MLDIRKFEPEDAEYICPIAVDEVLHLQLDAWRKSAMANANAGPAYTGLLNGEIVTVAGVRLYYHNGKKVGWLWAAFSPKIIRHRKTLLRSLKVMLNILVEEFKIEMLYADSRIGFSASKRLLNHLGFSESGKLTAEKMLYTKEII